MAWNSKEQIRHLRQLCNHVEIKITEGKETILPHWFHRRWSSKRYKWSSSRNRFSLYLYNFEWGRRGEAFICGVLVWNYGLIGACLFGEEHLIECGHLFEEIHQAILGKNSEMNDLSLDYFSKITVRAFISSNLQSPKTIIGESSWSFNSYTLESNTIVSIIEE